MYIIYIYKVYVNAWLYLHAGYAVKAKSMQAHSPKNGPASAQAKGTFQKVQGCSCCSAASMRGGTLTATSNAKTCVQPAAVYQTSKLTYFRTLLSRGRSVKLAILIGLVAKLPRMCSKATKHGVAFRTGLAAKLLRMRSKATNNFAIRIGSATKLLRKRSKE